MTAEELVEWCSRIAAVAREEGLLSDATEGAPRGRYDNGGLIMPRLAVIASAGLVCLALFVAMRSQNAPDAAPIKPPVREAEPAQDRHRLWRTEWLIDVPRRNVFQFVG